MRSVNFGSNPGVQAWKSAQPQSRVTVAVIDTGIHPHPDLADRVVGFKDFVNGRTEAYDDVGQGTHVAANVLGAGGGGSSVVGVKGGDAAGEVVSELLSQGIDWAVDNRGTLQISFISISATEHDDAVEKSIRRAIEAGITVVQTGSRPPVAPQEELLIGGPARVDASGVNLLRD